MEQGSAGPEPIDQRPLPDRGGETFLARTLATSACPAASRWLYEWQNRTDPATGKVWKQPWLFRPAMGALFWLGGIWDRSCCPDGGELERCVVPTTAPIDLLRRVDDRMP